jgi:D-hydroxyproline dehydrogenase subunit beta
MNRTADVAVIGAGIVGLAWAWAAARRGRSVVVFERGRRAEMASVRNFGMVWPIGQPAGGLYHTALASRQLWLRLRAEAGVWVGECGSLHAVYEGDEQAVLEEFAALAPALGVECELLAPTAATERFPHLNPDGLKAVLFSPTECVVDPRQAVGQLPRFLSDTLGVRFHFGTAVTGIDMPHVTTAGGERWAAGTVLVCGGADFETLFPAVYAGSGLRRCKLQMMATGPQPGGWRMGPHLAGGLTLAHYKAFEVCSALAAVKTRIAATLPEHVKFGIHVMASQNELGEVVIGDSHEYDEAITPFCSDRIDQLILDYLSRMLRLPDPAVARRWHGVYAKHPTAGQFTAQPQPGCHVIGSPGGAGMTLAFGLAEEWWDKMC